MLNISVIIPSNHSGHELLKTIHAICSQNVRPSEIIVIDSSVESESYFNKILTLCESNDIKLIYEHRVYAFPGHARNLGLALARAEWIAFLDVQTIPRSQWLEKSCSAILGNNVYGIFGSTLFVANTPFEKLVRDAFFGVLPRKTLPGSIFRRDVFTKTGHFIDWVRAGEDTEWMLRLDLLKIPVVSLPEALVDYVGLIGINIYSILKKWHRNYSASHELPHLFPQKLLLWMVLYPLIIFVGFNWNYLIANWHEDSPLYIAHITKMAAISPILTYLIARGIILPLRRGVSFFDLFPIRFIVIAAVCFIADAVKALVFSTPKRKQYATSK